MGGPFFIPDLSAWQGPSPDFLAIAADPRMVGAIIKSSQGLGPGVSKGHSPLWFQTNWPRVRAAGGWRYGYSFFRGCYHFASPASSGTAQADYMLDAVERAGGWGEGDLPPAWDLEGEAWSSGQQVVDISSQFAERVKQRLGRTPILYTGSTWRKFNIQESAGFSQMWTTHMDKMEAYGWPNTSVALWQYVGTGKFYNPATVLLGYPNAIAGLPSSIDMNVVMDGGVPAMSMERVLYVLTGRSDRSRAETPIAPPGRGQPARAEGRSSLVIPLAIGAGILTVGLLLARSARESLL